MFISGYLNDLLEVWLIDLIDLIQEKISKALRRETRDKIAKIPKDVSLGLMAEWGEVET
jgi:hypothetical protein